MNLYTEIDYKKALKLLVDEKKAIDKRFNFQRIAEQTKIPKSYLSKVVRGHADLNGDQLFKVTKALSLTEAEGDYLQMLLDLSRCTIPERKKLLRQKIKQTQTQQLQAKNHIKSSNTAPDSDGLEEYYYAPIHQIIHIGLSAPRYRNAPQQLAQDIGIPMERMLAALETLERLGIISRQKGKIKVETWDIHLPKTSKVYRTWREQIRLMSLQRLQTMSDENGYAFSATFNATDQDKKLIQGEFMNFLERIKPIVDRAKSEETYQLNFDLFSWTQT